MTAEAIARARLAAAIADAATGVWLIDLDDTLVATAQSHPRAARRVEQVLTASLGSELASMTSERFKDIFATLLASHQNRDQSGTVGAAVLEERVEAVQLDVGERWGGTKRFSREVLLLLAAQDVGARLSAELLETAVDAYWEDFVSRPAFMDSAREFVSAVGATAPVYIITGSDARMRLTPSGQFEYDPDRSRRLKERRLATFREKGLEFRGAIIGDPIDKPSPEFFLKAIDTVRRDIGSEPVGWAVLGDSFASDIETPLAMGITALAILLADGQRGVTNPATGLFAVGDLSTLLPLLPPHPPQRRDSL